MKKGQLLVPRNQAREVVHGPDLNRMLASGSYLVATIPKKPSAHAIAQRNFVRRHLEAGYREFHTLLPEHIFNARHDRCSEGDTLALLLERLLSESATDNGEKPELGTLK